MLKICSNRELYLKKVISVLFIVLFSHRHVLYDFQNRKVMGVSSYYMYIGDGQPISTSQLKSAAPGNIVEMLLNCYI